MTCCLCCGVLQPVAKVLPADLVLFEDSGKQVLFTSLLLLASGLLDRSWVLLDEGPAGWCQVVADQLYLSMSYLQFTAVLHLLLAL